MGGTSLSLAKGVVTLRTAPTFALVPEPWYAGLETTVVSK